MQFNRPEHVNLCIIEKLKQLNLESRRELQLEMVITVKLDIKY